MITQDKLIELLQEGKVTVSFTKKDGTQRVMVCTTSKDLVSFKTPDSSKSTSTKKENPNQIRVYDLEKEQWRSFNYNTITDVSFPAGMGIDPGTKAIGGVLVFALILYVLILIS